MSNRLLSPWSRGLYKIRSSEYINPIHRGRGNIMGSPYINIAYDHNQDHIMGEREYHIATGRISAPRRNYSRFMEEGSNSDGDESGGTSPSRQAAGIGILVPRNLMAMAAEIGIASG